jgi:hypothetical protein
MFILKNYSEKGDKLSWCRATLRASFSWTSGAQNCEKQDSVVYPTLSMTFNVMADWADWNNFQTKFTNLCLKSFLVSFSLVNSKRICPDIKIKSDRHVYSTLWWFTANPKATLVLSDSAMHFDSFYLLHLC